MNAYTCNPIFAWLVFPVAAVPLSAMAVAGTMSMGSEADSASIPPRRRLRLGKRTEAECGVRRGAIVDA